MGYLAAYVSFTVYVVDPTSPLCQDFVTALKAFHASTGNIGLIT